MGKMEEGNKTFCHSYNTETTHFLLEIEAKKRQTKAAPISFVKQDAGLMLCWNLSSSWENYRSVRLGIQDEVVKRCI